jgi:hypothetical protein
MSAPKLAFVGFFLLAAALIATPLYNGNPSEKILRAPSSSFSAGEHLVYVVKWDPPWYFFFLPAMEAGEIDLQLIGESEYNGNKAMKISFQAHSSGTLMKMTGMKIDDEFVFFTEPETFCTFHASKKIREGKRKRQIDITYLRETQQLRIRELDEAVVPPKLKKDETKDNIPPCVQDPLSALYFYRLSPLKVGHLQTFVIGHDDRVKEVSARVEKQENLETPAGSFSAWKVEVLSLMGGLFKEGGQFRIWFSADEKKIPIQFEFKVRLGRVLGKLKSR